MVAEWVKFHTRFGYNLAIMSRRNWVFLEIIMKVSWSGNTNFRFILKYLLCIWVFCLHICLCTTVFLVLTEARREHWIPWNWLLCICELLCGCWESNLSPQEEQPALLAAEPASHPLPIYLTMRISDMLKSGENNFLLFLFLSFLVYFLKWNQHY